MLLCDCRWLGWRSWDVVMVVMVMVTIRVTEL